MTYRLLKFTSENMTLEYCRIWIVTMATRKCKAHFLLTVRGTPGTKQNAVDFVACDVRVCPRIYQPDNQKQ